MMLPVMASAPQRPPIHIQGEITLRSISPKALASLSSERKPSTSAPPAKETAEARKGVPRCLVMTPLRSAWTGMPEPVTTAPMRSTATSAGDLQTKANGLQVGVDACEQQH